MDQPTLDSRVETCQVDSGVESKGSIKSVESRLDSSEALESIIFGPVLSRRFGLSLGVDLSPHRKQCNFDCVYCELHKAKPMDSMELVLPAKTVIQAITQALQTHSNVDVLSFTATGEPTLYPHLYEVITAIAPLLPQGTKSLILSNGSRFLAQSRALHAFDMVKFSLDAALPSAFKRVDRPSKSLDLAQILQGIKEFAASYRGELIAEVLLVQGHNDMQKNLYAIAEFLRQIPISRVDLGSIDRPSAYPVRALSQERLQELSRIFAGLPLSMPQRSVPKQSTFANTPQYPNGDNLSPRSPNEIHKLIATRPIACDEASRLFSQQELAYLQELVSQGLITIKQQGGSGFYVAHKG
ncbi:radical SAM protein [Helicobacter sp.]|uniref:radical SAM protein n=1 Tax=Helicobacter sp. TaxID=218 RepID=UPI0025C46063|nr:radical SAM protein [Helicobacter sp.]MBR2494799.1 radical SAM protein [Helicobacter sp.]